ncbi:phosphodiester glycosidase family protein [Nocardioides daejeonensis]|uniref:phosphodiester glycosidase family protein n=1 Tax=Nocardioides daejeonensis TaxID=1046556 RepID=UPI000D74D2CB|nr:phosphodiester glycosidase family protein [Nocardioides daejeonensis]
MSRLRGLVVTLAVLPVLAVGSISGAPVHAEPGAFAPGATAGTETGGGEQTSDGRPGWLVPRRLARQAPQDSKRRTWKAARGTTYTRWTRRDGRGPVRIHVLSVNLKRKVRIDAITPPRVAQRRTVSAMVRDSRALAGVNGDFFDIADTGAPLGVTVADGRLRNAPLSGWNYALQRVGKRWEVAPVQPVLKVAGRPDLVVTNLNSPTIAAGGIGLYTKVWGTSPGAAVTTGQERVREVVVRQGRVRSNRRRQVSGEPVRGQVLIGQGASAKALKALKTGTRVRVRRKVAPRTAFAIGGDRPLVLAGRRAVIDDRIMHPRTAVGIDRDRHRMLLVVVDGRSAASRGHTMVELAELMLELGADDALNLDGGGSSTLVARNRKGRMGVRNAPSDGAQRSVPNGIGVFARR